MGNGDRTTRKDKRELLELQAIKKLLVLQLLKADVQAASIAKLLDMDKGDFSKMFPARELLARHKRERHKPKRKRHKRKR